MALEMDKKEIRKQVNEILGWELSDAEFQGIDFRGIVENLEPSFDDLSNSMIGPMSIITGAVVCGLMGISIHDLAFLGVDLGVITVVVILGWAYIRRKKRTLAKKEILEAIKIYEGRAEVTFARQ